MIRVRQLSLNPQKCDNILNLNDNKLQIGDNKMNLYQNLKWVIWNYPNLFWNEKWKKLDQKNSKNAYQNIVTLYKSWMDMNKKAKACHNITKK